MGVVEDETVSIPSDDGEMSDAINEAKASIGEFFKAFKNPAPNQTSFLIKARFENDITSEHIWLADLDFNTDPATGVVANEPSVSFLRYMQRVSFLPDQISDWMFYEDQRLVGAFTTKLLLRNEAKPESLMGFLRRKFRKSTTLQKK